MQHQRIHCLNNRQDLLITQQTKRNLQDHFSGHPSPTEEHLYIPLTICPTFQHAYQHSQCSLTPHELGLHSARTGVPESIIILSLFQS